MLQWGPGEHWEQTAPPLLPWIFCSLTAPHLNLVGGPVLCRHVLPPGWGSATHPLGCPQLFNGLAHVPGTRDRDVSAPPCKCSWLYSGE